MSWEILTIFCLFIFDKYKSKIYISCKTTLKATTLMQLRRQSYEEHDILSYTGVFDMRFAKNVVL